MVDKRVTLGILAAVTLVALIITIAAVTKNKSTFCGGDPDPSAAAEARGLYMMGVRPADRFCGSKAEPAAVAEYQGLTQLGWQEQFSGSPANSCADPHPSAISEAQALQHVNALHPGSPYYTKSHFANGGPSNFGGLSRSRFDGARENFGGPAGGGYGWTSTDGGYAPVPATGGWGNAAALTAGRCAVQCLSGCATDCGSCKTECQESTQRSATGKY